MSDLIVAVIISLILFAITLLKIMMLSATIDDLKEEIQLGRDISTQMHKRINNIVEITRILDEKSIVQFQMIAFLIDVNPNISEDEKKKIRETTEIILKYANKAKQLRTELAKEAPQQQNE